MKVPLLFTTQPSSESDRNHFQSLPHPFLQPPQTLFMPICFSNLFTAYQEIRIITDFSQFFRMPHLDQNQGLSSFQEFMVGAHECISE